MSKMDVTYILYFGGQELCSRSVLRQLQARAADSSSLKTFLSGSLDIVRSEIKTLQLEVPSLADVSTFEHFVAVCANREPHDVVLSTVALYVAQMGDYVL